MLKGVEMSYKDNLPKTMDELKVLSFEERARLWAKYSQYPFKRQMRSRWYYIQCDRLNLRIEHVERYTPVMLSIKIAGNWVKKNIP